ncbi:GntR family transcriptional regulator [Labrenzia sp. OB1]|uniref:GntR family transcriptional regulator n=1 Tax=Labrenzia sp. OB1 TaxID=1561204 RepID=UPI000839A636|nr:GntR family transcriptional regulator [Labrenzia sp. OB1]
MQSREVSGTNSTEAVTARLRELILKGALPQGERVTESGLASLLQVSRTPIRLALATLQQEELVEGAPNRGFRVRRFTLEDLREIIEVRATLEGMAARLAAEKGLSQEQEDTLVRCIDELEVLIASGACDHATFQRFSEINIAFHATITEIAGNAALTRSLERTTNLPFRSAPMLYVLPREEALMAMSESQRDHIRLLDAIRQCQGARAEFLMREHALIPLAKAALLIEHMDAALTIPAVADGTF